MRGKRKKFFWTVASLLFIAAVCGAGFVSFYFAKRLAVASKEVKNLPEIMAAVNNQPSTIVSEDGVILFQEAEQYRKYVQRQDIPELVVHATLAAEDKRFFSHPGVDGRAMLRALMSSAKEGRASQGGSTLTMQLAKLVYSKSQKTFDRKVGDIALALEMENTLTKDQILELYLNEVFYGAGAYGVAAAADVYFGKSLNELTPGEAATLARCVRRPSDENPFDNLDKSIENRNVVLKTMLEENWVTQAEYDKASAEKLNLRTTKVKTRSSSRKKLPFIVDYVLHKELKKFPDVDFKKGGYTVEISVDTRLQSAIEDEYAQTLRRYRGGLVNTGAFVCLDSDGKILVMVGGPDYEKSQFNIVTQGLRQPGSSFKPFVYATAFQFGALSPFGQVNNEPFYKLEDHHHKVKVKGGGDGGTVEVIHAIASSNNTAACWAQHDAGTNNVINLCKTAFGFHSKLRPVSTLALGANEVSMMEMVEAYTVFQQAGDRIKPYIIKRIVGPDGTVLHVQDVERVQSVIGSEAARGMDKCLRAVVEGGTGSQASYVRNARGKTGTTSDHKDAWFCGYTNRFVGVVWLGREGKDRRGRPTALPMDGVMGGEYSAPMWAKLISTIQERLGEDDRKRLTGSARPATESETKAADEPGPTREERANAALGNDPAPDSTTPSDNSTADSGVTPPEPAPPEPIKPLVRSPKPATTEAEMVYVDVCADSGKRANSYCPETVRRAFKKGHEPKGVCRDHGP